MKEFTLTRSLLSLGLVIAVALGLSFEQATFPLSFSLQKLESRLSLWTGSDAHTFPTAQAAIGNAFDGWQSWPASQYYKLGNSEWVLPFEAFRIGVPQQFPPQASPLFIDINGDSLFDVLYSKYEEAWSVNLRYHDGNGWRDNYQFNNGSLSQYLFLNTGDGFRAVFRCFQTYSPSVRPEYAGHYLYFGDCADTSRPFNPSFHAPPFTAGTFFEDNFVPAATITGLDLDMFETIFFRCRNLDPYPSPGSPSERDCSRRLPQLLDVNGDGLIDTVFKGSYNKIIFNPNVNNDTRYVHSSVNLSYVLLNTGHGFAPKIPPPTMFFTN